MNHSKQKLDYNELQKLLDNNNLMITAAELQGLLMGFYAAGLAPDQLSWRQELMKQLAVQGAIPEHIDSQLQSINDTLCAMITSEIFGLELLLPDDEATIVARGEALGYWCQGFLLGYMQVTENKEETDEDVADSLSDIEEISNLDLDTIGDTEEDEKSLFELTEHIKVTAQLIHGVNGQSLDNSDATMH